MFTQGLAFRGKPSVLALAGECLALLQFDIGNFGTPIDTTNSAPGSFLTFATTGGIQWYEGMLGSSNFAHYENEPSLVWSNQEFELLDQFCIEFTQKNRGVDVEPIMFDVSSDGTSASASRMMVKTRIVTADFTPGVDRCFFQFWFKPQGGTQTKIFDTANYDLAKNTPLHFSCTRDAANLVRLTMGVPGQMNTVLGSGVAAGTVSGRIAWAGNRVAGAPENHMLGDLDSARLSRGTTVYDTFPFIPSTTPLQYFTGGTVTPPAGAALIVANIAQAIGTVAGSIKAPASIGSNRAAKPATVAGLLRTAHFVRAAITVQKASVAALLAARVTIGQAQQAKPAVSSGLLLTGYTASTTPTAFYASVVALPAIVATSFSSRSTIQASIVAKPAAMVGLVGGYRGIIAEILAGAATPAGLVRAVAGVYGSPVADPVQIASGLIARAKLSANITALQARARLRSPFVILPSEDAMRIQPEEGMVVPGDALVTET